MSVRYLAVPCCAALIGLMPLQARAQDDGQAGFTLSPIEIPIGEANLRIGGWGGVSAFASRGRSETSGITRLGVAEWRLQRVLDTGLTLGAHGDMLLAPDRLSGDEYGSNAIAAASLYIVSGLGTLDIGMREGAAAQLAMNGEKLSRTVSLDQPYTSFLRDPVTKDRIDSGLWFQTAASSSENNAKFTYLSPRLFGAQIGASYTPLATKSGLPYFGNPDDEPNRQDSLWEIAASYTEYFSNLSVGASLAYAHGQLSNRLAGADNLHDAAFGLQTGYEFSSAKISLGGGYRISNQEGFTEGRATKNGETRLAFLSLLLETGKWRVGGELASGDTNTPLSPDIGARGYQIGAGYQFSPSLQVNAGWQWRDFARDMGLFYNGASRIDMNAAFLTLDVSL